MILSDSKILEEIESGSIVIEPFRRKSIAPDSYDVHLGETIAVYNDTILDSRKHNKTTLMKIPEEGFVLEPDKFYLGVTRKYTETHRHVPFLEGKSSVERLGIDIHATAGKGDVGFCNHWTLEISVKQPVRVYPGMPIGQLIYFGVDGDVDTLFSSKGSAKYNGRSNLPVESHMFRNSLRKLPSTNQRASYRPSTIC